MKAKILVLLLTFVMFLGFGGIVSADVHYITDCTTITQPGTYYLTQDIINSTNSYCMNISANNVVLDCQNHLIDGNDAADYGIYVYRSPEETTNITIKNCRISDWDSANIYFYRADKNYLENITSTSSPDYGIFLNQTSSNTLSNIIVQENSFYDINIGAMEDSYCNNQLINVTGSNNLPILYYNSSVNLENQELSQLILCNADYSNVNNITISGSGLWVKRTDYSNITNIISNNNNIEGIYLSSSSYNILLNITVNYNEWGILLSNSHYNTLLNITANNNDYGIRLSYSSSSNTLSNSTILRNNNYGLYLCCAAGQSGANLIYNNFFNNTNNYYISGTYFNNWNTSKTSGTNIVGGSYLAGNYWAKPDGTGFSETCSDADGDGICDQTYTIAKNNIDYLPLTYISTTPTTCQPDQTILRLSSETNAHGQTADYNGAEKYPVSICYPDIFGHEYTGSNPHECNGNNLILRLSDETNAHGEITGIEKEESISLKGRADMNKTKTMAIKEDTILHIYRWKRGVGWSSSRWINIINYSVKKGDVIKINFSRVKTYSGWFTTHKYYYNLFINGNFKGEFYDGIKVNYSCSSCVYPVDVCYGNLECQAITDPNNDCSSLGPDYKEVVRLSDETNAHLELPSYEAPTSEEFEWTISSRGYNYTKYNDSIQLIVNKPPYPNTNMTIKANTTLYYYYCSYGYLYKSWHYAGSTNVLKNDFVELKNLPYSKVGLYINNRLIYSSACGIIANYSATIKEELEKTLTRSGIATKEEQDYGAIPEDVIQSNAVYEIITNNPNVDVYFSDTHTQTTTNNVVASTSSNCVSYPYTSSPHTSCPIQSGSVGQWLPIPNMTIERNFPESTITIFVNLTVRHWDCCTPCYSGAVRVLIDGEEIKKWRTGGCENSKYNFVGTFTKQITEGYHVIQVQWKTDENWGRMAFEVSPNNEVRILTIDYPPTSHILAKLKTQGNYPVKICCKEGGAIVGGGYWADMTENPINESDIEDSVKLIILGSELEGVEINYTIYKDRFWFFDKRVAQFSTKGFLIWEAGKDSEGNFESGDYYFIATLPDGTEVDSRDNENYGILHVKDSVNNEPPHAVIVKPEADSYHLINASILFEQASYDVDDELNITWYFDDGTMESFTDCQSGTNCNTTHSYETEGTKIIKLIAKEKERGQKDEDARRIFIYDEGINVFPVIVEPDPNIVTTITGWKVRFNANESYVANCSYSLCPESVGNCYNITETVDGEEKTLYCYDLSKSDIGTTYNLWFNWTFDDGTSIQGNWIDNYNEVVEFEKVFSSAGEHFAILKVGYEPY